MRNDMRTQNRTVPLAALVDGDANVRSTATSRGAMEELKASILAHQLIGRLAVREQPGESDRYGVVAGHRRYKALQELLEEKKIDASYPVPIRVLDGTDDDLEIALAENVCRVAMEPLDQCATFVRLIDGGAAIDEIATRFGISKRTVEQRLRLTNLAPDVIAAYKAGDINYETMSAFGNTTDHELQARTLERVQYAYAVTAKTVEAALRNEHVPATSAKARYIGLNAYEEAGGHVETNLFGDDDSTYLVDVELLDRLVMEKLQAKANALMKRWKWAEARLQFGYADTQGLGRVEPKAGEYTEKEQTELTLHESEMDRIAEIVNGGVDEDSEKTAELREEYGNHERAIATLQQKVQRRSQFSAAQRKIAGCHVSLGGDGRVSITYGLVRPEDVPQPAPKTAAKKAATKAGTNGQAPETGQESSDAPADNAGTGGEAPVEEVVVIGPRGATYGGAPSGGKDREKTAVEKAGLNQALADDLRHVRVALVRHHLAKDPDAALDLLLFTQLRGERSHYSGSRPLDVAFRETANMPTTHAGGGETAFAAHSPGIAMLEAAEEELPLAWRNERGDKAKYEALRALPDSDKRRLLAHLIAKVLQPQLSMEEAGEWAFEATVGRLGIDFAGTLRPSKELYWNRITKARMLEIATTVLGKQWADGHSGDKKGELASAMEAAFSAEGTDELNAKQRAAAAAWTYPGFAGPADKPARKARKGAGRKSAGTKPNGRPKPAASPGNEVPEESATVPAFLTTGGAEPTPAAGG